MAKKLYTWPSDRELDYHDVALLFPEMSDDEFDRLKAHISEHGLQDKILTLNGKIIDGRHRALVCQELEIPIECEEWEGDPEHILDFVIGQNLARRHLTQSQKAMVAVEVEKHIAEDIAKQEKMRKAGKSKSDLSKIGQVDLEPRDATKEAAQQVGVSRSYVADAKAVVAKSPETAKEVRDGKLTLPEAKKALGNGHASGNGQTSTQEIPRHFLPLLADLPPGQQVAAFRKAVAAAPDGVPTKTQIIKAAGLVVQECPNPKKMDDIIAEHEEEVAIADESDSDEEWLEQLPLTGQLSAACQRVYYAEALAMRWLAKAQATWGRAVATVLGKMKHRKGPAMYRIQMGLKLDPPEKWVRCADLTEGGCAGKGHIKTGDSSDAVNIKCPACFGNGYRVVS